MRDQNQNQYCVYAEHLTVGYHGTPIVRDLEIKVQKGRIVTLIGPNGAGKSTILKTFIGQLSPIVGVIYLDGQELASISGRELAQRLAMVMTERIDPELMTCRDVVSTARYPYTGGLGLLADTDRRAVDEALELVQITEMAEQPFACVSDGQRQRVMLARAICQEPEVLVLDEPTSYLDIRYKLEILSTLKRLVRERGLAVLMSLHELDLARQISDMLVCIRDGRADRIGTPEEIFSGDYIRELYGITPQLLDEARKEGIFVTDM